MTPTPEGAVPTEPSPGGLPAWLEAVLLSCLAPASPLTDAALRGVADGVADWAALTKAATDQGLAGLLTRRLVQAAVRLPAEGREALERLAAQVDLRASRATGQLVRMVGLLADNGVAAMPIKGPAQSQDLHGDVACRTFTDLDIVVPAADALRARELLVAEGFTLVQPRRADVPERRLLHGEGELAVAGPDGDPLVELHWRVGWRFPSASIAAEELLARPRSVELFGREVLQPAPVDQLIVLCVHGSHHAWEKLELMAGVLAAADRLDDAVWPSALERAAQLGQLRRTLVGMVVSHRVAGLSLPLPVRLAAAGDPLVGPLVAQAAEVWRRNALEEPDSVERLRRILWLARTGDSVKDGLGALWRRAVTPGYEDWDSLRLPWSLAGLYYLWRPLRLAAKFAPRTSRPD